MSQQRSDYVEQTDIDASLDDQPDDETIDETVANLEANEFEVVVDTAEEALETLKSHIPTGASVMNGHSTTLEEVGFVEYLTEGDHEWNALPNEIWSIDEDAEQQAA